MGEAAAALDVAVGAPITDIQRNVSLCLCLPAIYLPDLVWNWQSVVHKLEATSLTNGPIPSSLKEERGRSRSVSNHVDGSNSIDRSWRDRWFAFE